MRATSWLLALSSTMALLFPGTVVLAGESPEDPVVLERIDQADPPGARALPVPGAPLANKVRQGGFTSVQVNVDGAGANVPGDAANEPSLAVDLARPNRLAIGWRQFNTTSSNFREAGVAYSDDGGRTWTADTLDPGVFRSDPVLSSDAQGNFYYYSIAVPDFPTLSLEGGLFVSQDGGKTWGAPLVAPTGDKPWVAIDPTGGLGDGNFYAVWSQALACCADSTFVRTADGGFSYSAPVVVPSSPVWGTLTVDIDGFVHVAGRIDDGEFVVARSSNARDPAVPPTFDQVTPINLGGDQLAFAPTSPNPEGLLGQVWIAAGPASGQLYVLSSVNPPGPDPMDVRFLRSLDGGQTWSASERVNADPAVTNAWQWFGTMSVAPGGRIDVVWNDTRQSGQSNQSQLYYTFSNDGGLSWAAEQVLSPTWNSHLGWPNQAKIGDYYHMVSDDVGAHLAWAATFNGEQDIYYLRIGDYDCNVNGVGDAQDINAGTSLDMDGNGIPDECEGAATSAPAALVTRLEQNAPNPFNPQTVIRFDVRSQGDRIRLAVFDVAGRQIRVLEDSFLAGGSHQRSWDGRDGRARTVASGLYYYRLQASDGTWTRKMQLLK